MNKVISMSIIILGLTAGLPAQQVLAETKNEVQTTQSGAEQGWTDALQTQVAVARARVSLLQARTELWLEQNKVAALQSLDDAKENLDNAWRSADSVTRARIVHLQQQIKPAAELLQEQGQAAEDELQAMSERSEAVLNAALARAQAKGSALQDEAATRYALNRARAAALNARVALEIDKSHERAQQALLEAEDFLGQAQASASEASAVQITRLQGQAQTARDAVLNDTELAKFRIRELIDSTQDGAQAYGQSIQESEEVTLLKKRYRQVEARSALLKANLAARTDETKGHAIAYLEESRGWYEGLKSRGAEQWNQQLVDMSARIDQAKQAVQQSDDQARTQLADLLERAAAMIKDEPPSQ